MAVTGEVVLKSSEYANFKTKEILGFMLRAYSDGNVCVIPQDGGDALEIIRCALEEAFSQGAEAALEQLRRLQQPA